MQDSLRTGCRDAKDRSTGKAGVVALTLAAHDCRSIERTLYIDQSRIRVRAVIGVSAEVVQHLFRSARRETKDRPAVEVIRTVARIRAACAGRAVERAAHVDQAGDGISAIASCAEVMQDVLSAARRDAIDRSAAVVSPKTAVISATRGRRAVQRAAHVDYASDGISAIASTAEAIHDVVMRTIGSHAC